MNQARGLNLLFLMFVSLMSLNNRLCQASLMLKTVYTISHGTLRKLVRFAAKTKLNWSKVHAILMATEVLPDVL